jgi:hypothetical protein
MLCKIKETQSHLLAILYLEIESEEEVSLFGWIRWPPPSALANRVIGEILRRKCIFIFVCRRTYPFTAEFYKIT